MELSGKMASFFMRKCIKKTFSTKFDVQLAQKMELSGKMASFYMRKFIKNV